MRFKHGFMTFKTMFTWTFVHWNKSKPHSVRAAACSGGIKHFMPHFLASIFSKNPMNAKETELLHSYGVRQQCWFLSCLRCHCNDTLMWTKQFTKYKDQKRSKKVN